MRDDMQARLEDLRQQFGTGQRELQELQARETYLREATIRISGAIQVLEELLGEAGTSENND